MNRTANIALASLCLLLGLNLYSRAATALNLNESNGQITVDGKARFTVVDQRCVRLEYSEKQVFIDNPSLFAVNRQARFLNYKITRNSAGSSVNNPAEAIGSASAATTAGDSITIDTGIIKLTYKPDGAAFNATNLVAAIDDQEGHQSQWHFGQINKENLGGTLHNLDHVKGEVKLNEGLLARDGWYVIDDSSRAITTPQNGEEWVSKRPDGAGIDAYLFGYGQNYHAAMKAFTNIGGAVPLPRKYVLGSWYSRWWPYTSQDYRKIVGEFHDHQFPLDMIVMDMDWHKTDSWTGYTFNQKLFPDGEEYLKWLHANNLHATFNDHPQAGVGPYEDRYNEFMNAMGKGASRGEIIPYNMGDQHYINTEFKITRSPLEKMGVDFWWLDWMGGMEFPFNNVDWVNQYYYQHSRKTGLRGQLFARYADWGDHRHPIHFSGDSHSDWPTLEFEVPFTSTSSNAGAFYWSHDMGGFEGPRNGELLARWTQFGAFSAALRLHSINSAYQDKRPWGYSAKVEESMRISFQLRSMLFPYTYSMAYKAYHDSVPLIRPLYLEYSGDEEAYHNRQEYLYGDSILVAPIVKASTDVFNPTASQKVWLPKGVWYHWFTHERIVGPTTRTFTHDLKSFPVFVKAGAPLTMQPVIERMTTAPLKNLVVRVFAGDDQSTGKTVLYEDDGVTENYLEGEHALTKVTYARRQSTHVITIDATQGSYDGQVTQRQNTVELIGVKQALHVTVNGASVPFDYDAATYTHRIVIPQHSINDKVVVTLDAALAEE